MQIFGSKRDNNLQNGPRVNWLPAFAWTAIVSAISTTFFIVGTTYYIKSTGVLDKASVKNRQAISSLQIKVDNQAKLIRELADKSENVVSYLKLWTPIACEIMTDDEVNVIDYDSLLDNENGENFLLIK